MKIYLVTTHTYFEDNDAVYWNIAGAFTTKESAEKFAKSYNLNPEYEWIEINGQAVPN